MNPTDNQSLTSTTSPMIQTNNPPVIPTALPTVPPPTDNPYITPTNIPSDIPSAAVWPTSHFPILLTSTDSSGSHSATPVSISFSFPTSFPTSKPTSDISYFQKSFFMIQMIEIFILMPRHPSPLLL